MVEHTLGIPIDYYAETSLVNFANIINTIGGLTVDVPYAMNYDFPNRRRAILKHPLKSRDTPS